MPGDGAVSPRSAVRCGLGVREGPRPGRCEGGGCPAWSAAGGRARMGAAAGGAGCLGALRRPGRRRARRCAGLLSGPKNRDTLGAGVRC